MLEVKGLSKIYKSKKGAPVKALDDVSLTFPEKGMVFLLGKSGSGKSTLLNVCGGLDSPTSGEIIVKGRSSKNFSQSDFDSYRNTFIGFIFQEYNILNEFTVEDNIALALELQNKPKDKAAVEKLLNDVDLKGFAKRKPNTLSGGQKQRIAIARALIKSPEIIMADEPSGALDSATGKQVFETLKKLSLEKLVIVVSHDRDFAEQYGDRIIELKDGRVISDVSKTLQNEVSLTKNISSMGDILSIKQGASLDDDDFEQIKSFLKNTNNDIIITSGEKQVEEFKKANRINDGGEREVFRDTKPQERKEYRPEDSRFIRSRLPLRHAVKIGLSGLKSKPVRLFFTVLLCTCAFIMFALLSTLSLYNSESTFKETLQNTDKNTVRVHKEFATETSWYFNGEMHSSSTGYSRTEFTADEIEDLKAVYGNDVFSGVSVSLDYNVRTTNSKYYKNKIETVALLTENNSLYQSVKGEYPTADNEILISSYMADVLYTCQTYDSSGNTVTLGSADDAIGKTLIINNTSYKITGIFDSGVLPAEYDVLKENSEEADNQRLESSLYYELSDGLHLVAFTNENTLKRIAKEHSYEDYYANEYRSVAAAIGYKGKTELPEHANAVYKALSELNADEKLSYTDSQKTALGDNEAIVSQRYFFDTVSKFYSEKYEQDYESPDAERYLKVMEACSKLSSGGTLKFDEATKKDSFIPLSDTEMQSTLKTVMDAVKRDGINLKVDFRLIDSNTAASIGEIRQFNVVGFYFVSGEQQAYQETLYVADAQNEALWNEQKKELEFYETYSTKYVPDENAFYTTAFLPYDKSEEQTNAYWNIYNNKKLTENDTRIKLSDNFVSELEMVDDVIKTLANVFLYVGLVLALFAVLLFSNFISVSISQKKKDIGILRAVGAKGSDVFKIFFSESAFIAIICVALSTAASVIICDIMNKLLAENIGASLLVFGIPSFAILVGIAVLTAIIATFLPVFSAAKRKPIDSIRAV